LDFLGVTGMPEEGVEPTLTVKWTGFWVQCVINAAKRL